MPAQKGKPVPSRQKYSDEELIEAIKMLGVGGAAKKFGVDVRGVHLRRRRIEEREGVVITPPTRGGHVQQLDRHPAVIQLGIQDGHVLIGSDSHYWPGIVSTAHSAFLEFCREFKPKVVIKNGDELDFPSISRFEASSWLDWEQRPSVAAEIENTQAMLAEVEKVSPKARHIWPIGNHDGRFERTIATRAPELAKIKGVHLKDFFDKWEPCMATFINDDVVVKHRPPKGGIHSARNSTLAGGRTTICGHLHSLMVTPHSDYNGTRWGVDCGTMADPYGPQFASYCELGPMNWRSGFILCTFVKGKLLWPEVVFVSGPGTVQFRGKEWCI